jgi:hypothetical protein
MPYIAKDRRVHFDQQVDAIIGALDLMEWNEGDLNYILSRILGAAFEAEMRYHTSPRVRGVLHDVCEEFYHRIIRKYEDIAIAKNGDIPEYARLVEALTLMRIRAGLENIPGVMEAPKTAPEEKQ